MTGFVGCIQATTEGACTSGLAHAGLAATYTTGTRSRAEHTAAAKNHAQRLGSGHLANRVAAIAGSTAALDPRITPRESDIALLVAEGHTNAAIAQRLVLSERTVENHVAQLLHKLDLRTRAALAVWVRQPPQPDKEDQL